jgi:hypothetical protein
MLLMYCWRRKLLCWKREAQPKYTPQCLAVTPFPCLAVTPQIAPGVQRERPGRQVRCLHYIKFSIASQPVTRFTATVLRGHCMRTEPTIVQPPLPRNATAALQTDWSQRGYIVTIHTSADTRPCWAAAGLASRQLGGTTSSQEKQGAKAGSFEQQPASHRCLAS